MYFFGSNELIIFSYIIARCGHHYGPAGPVVSCAGDCTGWGKSVQKMASAAQGGNTVSSAKSLLKIWS